MYIYKYLSYEDGEKGGSHMKNNVIKSLLGISLLFLLVGCAAKPEATVSGYLDAIQGADAVVENSIDVSPYVSGGSESLMMFNMGSEAGGYITQRYLELLYDFDYKMGKSTVDGDNATVMVTITTYPIGQLFMDYISSYMTKVFEWSLAGYTEEELMTKGDELFEELSTGLEKTYVKEVSVYLIKEDGDWVIDDDDNLEFFSAITGGMLEAFDQTN